MLLYRRWCAETSEGRTFPENVPSHIVAAVEQEAKETEAKELEEKLRMDTMNVWAFPGSCVY